MSVNFDTRNKRPIVAEPKVEGLFDTYLKKNEAIGQYKQMLQARAVHPELPTLLILNKTEAEELKNILQEAEQARRAWFWTVGSPIGIERS
jgi:hypothetical protein